MAKELTDLQKQHHLRLKELFRSDFKWLHRAIYAVCFLKCALIYWFVSTSGTSPAWIVAIANHDGLQFIPSISQPVSYLEAQGNLDRAHLVSGAYGLSWIILPFEIIAIFFVYHFMFSKRNNYMDGDCIKDVIIEYNKITKFPIFKHYFIFIVVILILIGSYYDNGMSQGGGKTRFLASNVVERDFDFYRAAIVNSACCLIITLLFMMNLIFKYKRPIFI